MSRRDSEYWFPGNADQLNESAIEAYPEFEFLEGTLDGWPEPTTARRKHPTSDAREESKENEPDSQPEPKIVENSEDGEKLEHDEVLVENHDDIMES
ncbi:unnamed protein product [Anisakis simplex]|uniref:Uncharacterized protein n=1 Tax=Anisakis simplex TaxID=6269 RepID=A0A0M3JCL9_ANISI|nr:unnamed protein product [Anisakis simplex]